MVIQDVFNYFRAIVGFQIVLFLLGHVLCVFFGLKTGGSWITVFLKYLTGLLTIVMIVATVVTSGNTVMIGILIVAIGLFHSKILTSISIKDFWIWKQELMKVVILMGIQVLFFLVLVWNYSSNGIFKVPHGDSIFYARLSYFLFDNGYESTSFQYAQGASPYHFFDIWITGIIAKFFALNHLKTYVLLTQSLFFSLTLIGIAGFIENHIRLNRFWIYFLASSSLLLSGIYFEFFQGIKLLDVSYIFTYNPLKYPKLVPIYFGVILISHFLLQSKHFYALLSSLILPVISISTAPGVFLSVPVLILLWMRKDFLTRSESIRILAITFSLAAFVFLFYLFNKSAEDAIGAEFIKLNSSYIQTVINVQVGTFLTFLVLFAPPLIIFISSQAFRLLPASVCQYFVATSSCLLISWSIFHPLLNSVQFFSNLMLPLVNVLSLFLFARAISLIINSKVRQVAIVLFAFVLLVNVYNFLRNPQLGFAQFDRLNPEYVQYLQNIEPELYSHGDKKRNIRVGYIKSAKSYTNIFSKTPQFAILGGYLTLYRDNLEFYSMSIFDSDLGTQRQKGLVQESAYYRFVKSLGGYNSAQHCDNYRRFIETYSINFLILDNGVKVPECLLPNVVNTTGDNSSGQTFIRLKRSSFSPILRN